jgi:hypothetical protein
MRHLGTIVRVLIRAVDERRRHLTACGRVGDDGLGKPTHNGCSMLLRECAQSSSVVIAKAGDFSVEFDDSGGLKNRCRLGKKKLDLVSADFTYTYRLR